MICVHFVSRVLVQLSVTPHFVVSLFVLTLPGGCEIETFNLYVEGAVLTTAKEATLDVSEICQLFFGRGGLNFHRAHYTFVQWCDCSHV